MFILTRQFDKLGFVGELGIDSLRRGRVSRPPEFRDLYGAGRETRPIAMESQQTINPALCAAALKKRMDRR